MVTAAVIGGGLVAGAGASIYGANKSASAARKAAAAQSAAADQSIAFQRESRDLAREDLDPFKKLGTRNIGGLESLINDPTAQLNYVQDNPFFKALADETTNRLLQNQAASGKVGSGGTAEALQNSLLLLGNDLVQQQIGNKQNLVAMGQSAAAGQGAATMNAANQISSLYTQQGNSAAAGIVGAANAKNQGIQSIANLAGTVGGAYAGSPSGSAAISNFFACDVRLKENIQEVGKLNNGLPLYLFNYKNDPDKKLHINVMAQDVEKVNPCAVEEIDGYKYVNMEKIWQ